MNADNDQPQDNTQKRFYVTERTWDRDVIMVCSALTLIVSVIAVLYFKGQTACGCCVCGSHENCGEAKRIAALEETVETLRKEVKTLKEAGSGNAIFAKVTLTNKETFTGGDTVIFTHPMINVGNAYNTDFGFFAPPINGTYSFSAQICSYPASLIVFGIMKNSDIMDETFVGDTSWHQCGTSTGVFYATTTDKIWVKVFKVATGKIDREFGISSFSAALINTYLL